MPPQTAANQSAPNFAGLLAALASAKESNHILPADDPINDQLDGLEPDIATLNYDRALRTHARYHPASIPDSSLNASPNANPDTFSPSSKPKNALKAASNAPPAAAAGAPSKLEQTRKRASITIRLTQSECAQLQQRAAEAGLTVSAYLRSCTFEVESLRAQVKQALAELRSSQSEKPHTRRSFFRAFRP